MPARFVQRAIAIALAIVITPLSLFGQAREAPTFTLDQFHRWFDEVSNWGRWGPEDELGTLNLITPEVRVAATRLVRDGHAVSLARDLDTERSADNGRPLGIEVNRIDPYVGHMSAAVEALELLYHGYAHTHIDGLGHVWYRGELYNGFPASEVEAIGAGRLGTEVMHEGIVTRGVLVDLPRFYGVDYLEMGTAVMAEDLEAWERESGVTIRSGDVLLIRTGRWVRRAEVGPWEPDEFAGLHTSVAPWLRERGVAVLGSDAANEVVPTGVEGMPLPMHVLTIVAMGMPLLDNLDLDAIAEVAAQRNQPAFLLNILPLRIPGGIGSPVNPVAVF